MLNKIYIRIKLIMRNNLYLLPNLLNIDLEAKIYIFTIWLNNNISYFNPFNKFLQEIVLLCRVKNSRNKSYINYDESISDSDLIEKLDIYYINLEHRIDRKREMINEFDNLGLRNYKRFDATRDKNGLLGCALSHRAVLERWNPKEDRFLMVCEDDVSFLGDNKIYCELLNDFRKNKDLDVLCLAFNHFNKSTYNNNFYLTSNTQTASCYVLKPHMKDILIDNYSLSVNLLRARIDSQYRVANDQVWKVLQKKYMFVIPRIRFAIQRESFSDIEKKIVDYKV